MKIGFFIHFRLIILLITFVYSNNSFASGKDLFEKANNQYSEGLFFDAIENYYQLLDEGYRNADVYFNLGNAYYRLGKVGKSILNYERALLYEPGNAEISHNLYLANQRSADIITAAEGNFSDKIWIIWKGLFTSTTWSVLSLIFIWFACLLSLLAIFFVKSFTIKFTAYLSALIFGVFSFFFLFTSNTLYKEKYERSYGILMTTTADLKSEPANSGETLFRISEGTRFEVLRNVENHSYVRLENANSGWLKKDYFEEIF